VTEPGQAVSVEKAVAAATVAVSSPVSSGEVNISELMKQIEVPVELKHRPQEAVKYQMEQLKKKVIHLIA
jgi:hypothetical protein